MAPHPEGIEDTAEVGQVAHVLPRVFLVVVDETEEWRAALRFAARRAEHTGGRVALLHVIETGELQHWTAVEEVMRAELRQEAEQLMQRIAREVYQMTGTIPAIHLREGTPRDELLRVMAEDDTLSIVVLGQAPGGEGPGPLITYLTSKRVGKLPLPVTIVPGQLTDEEIDRLA